MVLRARKLFGAFEKRAPEFSRSEFSRHLRSLRSAEIEPGSETMANKGLSVNRNAGKKYSGSAFTLCLYRSNTFQIPLIKCSHSHFKATKVYQLTKSYTSFLQRHLGLEMQANEIHVL